MKSKAAPPVVKVAPAPTPEARVHVDLGYRPRDWQRECHRRRRRFTVLVMHRRAGKTEMALRQLTNEGLKCREDSSLYVYVAPFLKQAKLIAWDRLKAIGELIPGCKINESDLFILLPNNATIRIFGADNPDALRGARIDGAVIDEVAQIKPEVWNEILQPALSDRLGWAMFLGTPKGINLFSELYNKAVGLPDWSRALYTVYDTDAIDPVEVERLRRDMPENEFNREFLCDFTAAAEDQLMSVRRVEDAARRMWHPKDFSFAAKILGVDPARFGDDKTVIIRRQGLQVFQPKVFEKMGQMEVAAQVAYEINEWEPDAVFIDTGMGAGIIDRLRQMGYSIVEVAFGGRPDDPQFNNKRTEMWWRASDWIDDGGALPYDMGLKQDLATPTYWIDDKGRKCLEPKDDCKKRLGHSPDSGDALALTFAYPVAAANRRHDPTWTTKPATQQHYDPFTEED